MTYSSTKSDISYAGSGPPCDGTHRPGVAGCHRLEVVEEVDYDLIEGEDGLEHDALVVNVQLFPLLTTAILQQDRHGNAMATSEMVTVNICEWFSDVRKPHEGKFL